MPNRDGFDLMLDAAECSLDAAAETITEAVREKRYVPMTFSRKVMREVELSHRLRSLLVDLDADATVEVIGTGVNIRAHATGTKRAKTLDVIEQRMQGIEGVEQVNVQVFDNDMTSSLRR